MPPGLTDGGISPMQTRLTRRALLQTSALTGACAVLNSSPFATATATTADVAPVAPYVPGVFALSPLGSGLAGIVMDADGMSLRSFASTGRGLYAARKTLSPLPDSFIPAGLVTTDGAVVMYGGEFYQRATVQFDRGTPAAGMRAPFASSTLQLAPSHVSAAITGIRPAAYSWTKGGSSAQLVSARLTAQREGMILSVDRALSTAILVVSVDDSDALTRAAVATWSRAGNLEVTEVLVDGGEETNLGAPPVATAPAIAFVETGTDENRLVTPIAASASWSAESRPGRILATASAPGSAAVLVDPGAGLPLLVWESNSGWGELGGDGPAVGDLIGVCGDNSGPLWAAVKGADQIQMLGSGV